VVVRFGCARSIRVVPVPTRAAATAATSAAPGARSRAAGLAAPAARPAAAPRPICVGASLGRIGNRRCAGPALSTSARTSRALTATPAAAAVDGLLPRQRLHPGADPRLAPAEQSAFGLVEHFEFELVLHDTQPVERQFLGVV